MLYNVVFGCHGNTCYVIVIGAFLYMIYSTGQINVCTDFEINRFRIDEVSKYAKKMMFYLTSGDAKTVRRTTWFNFRFKSYGSNSGFRVFGDLDL